MDHHTIKTRDGELMRVLLIEGWPFETTDDDKIDALKALKNTVYRGIASPTTGIYTHIIRRKVDVSLPGEIDDTFGDQLNSKYQSVLEGRTLYRNFLYLTIIERPNIVTRSQQKMAERKKPKPRKPGRKPLKRNPRKILADKKRDEEMAVSYTHLTLPTILLV